MRAATLFTSLALATGFGVAAPIWKPQASAILSRSEAGPEAGGANFPDPSIIQVNGVWYAFATRTIGASIHIQVASSPDFNTWTIQQKDALPTIPAWVDQSSPNTWAPDVNQLDDGSFIMYYSATTTANTSKHCVGAATASSVVGPYTPVGSSALICPLSHGGAIDASGYDDNGKRYIVYKVDGNSIGHGGACGNDVAPYVPTPIVLQPVASDGHTFAGSATTLLDNDGAADMGIIEAPSLVKSGSTYVLFFSSDCFTSPDYTVSYATASSITGPYSRSSTPLFANGGDGLSAPGGADIHKDGQHMLFHANYGSGRALYTATVTIAGTSVTA